MNGLFSQMRLGLKYHQRKKGSRTWSRHSANSWRIASRKRTTIEFSVSLTCRLPRAWDLIEREISINDEALSSLPQSFSDNPQQKLSELCDDFRKRVMGCILGKGQSDNFIDDCLCQLCKELADKIRATRPEFQIPEPPPKASSSPELSPPRLSPSPDYSSTPPTISPDETESDRSDTVENPPSQEGNIAR